MQFIVYHPADRRLFVGTRGKVSPFGHTWGGSVDYVGLTPPTGGPPVHLFFRLNTADPVVGVTLPSARWLPLLCAMRYGATALGYRVVSDEAVELLRQAETKPWAGFPSDDYPERLPSQSLNLARGQYDPDTVLDVLRQGAVFGYDHLSPAVREAAGREAVEAVEGLGFGCDGPDEALAEWGYPFAQGKPVEDCPDPRCANHGRPSSLRTLAIFREGPDGYRDLWGPHCDDLQIIWQLCPACGAVQATNQCT